MHIDRILLRGVGPFDDVTIEFPKGTDPKAADVYLLTGPNGSGKSTILYALASLIGRGSNLGEDLAQQRLRTSNSLIAISTQEVTSAYRSNLNGLGMMKDPFGDREDTLKADRTRPSYYDSESKSSYVRAASSFGHAPDANRFSWAAFAYAGLRSVNDAHVAAIRPPSTSPFDASLSFVTRSESSEFVNWIAHQHFRRLKAKEAGNDERAQQLAQSVEDIERVIGEIIDDSTFGFAITDEDDDVRVRWRGVTVRLGLLPDGLKSIVSWVADLLMRLDRIPWQDNTPVLQRPFLLLLDEIDVHLHPSWQRKVLPLVQRMFPNAQIIASTHSPFVVGSMVDGRIITLGLRGSSAFVKDVSEPQLGVSYPAVLRSIFGIDSEFDVDTEHALVKFREAKQRLLRGDDAARSEVDQIAKELAERSEELRELIALEMGQLRRQSAVRVAP